MQQQEFFQLVGTAQSIAEHDSAETAQKRAQWEQFAFNIQARTRRSYDESHSNPADHQYVVSINDVTDELMACTCPHHVHLNAVCKHIAGVETATSEGLLEAFPSEDEDDAEPEKYDCDCLSGFSCWECVRAGRKTLPN